MFDSVAVTSKVHIVGFSAILSRLSIQAAKDSGLCNSACANKPPTICSKCALKRHPFNQVDFFLALLPRFGLRLRLGLWRLGLRGLRVFTLEALDSSRASRCDKPNCPRKKVPRADFLERHTEQFNHIQADSWSHDKKDGCSQHISQHSAVG